MNNIEEIVQKRGAYAAVVRGISMTPLLRDRRDTVYLEPPKTVKRLDVAAFRRANGQVVLHRVIAVSADHLIMRGDHDMRSETIARTQVIGVMTAFARDARTYTVSAWWYRAYSRLWTAGFGLRKTWRRLRGVLRRR